MENCRSPTATVLLRVAMARAVAKTLSLLKYLWIITTILFILLLRVLPAVLDFGNQDGLTRGLPISSKTLY